MRRFHLVVSMIVWSMSACVATSRVETTDPCAACPSGTFCDSAGACLNLCNSARDCTSCDTCDAGLCRPLAVCDDNGSGTEGQACQASAECGGISPICDETCRSCATHQECQIKDSTKPFCMPNGSCLNLEPAAPSLPPMVVSGEADGPITIDWRAVATDSDSAASVLVVADYRLVSGAPGALSVDGSGSLSYDPQGAYDSAAALEQNVVAAFLRIADEFGLESGEASVTINVFGVNDPPVLVADGPYATNTLTAISLDVVANDTDPDTTDTVRTLSQVSPPSRGGLQAGTATIDNNQILFTPDYSRDGTYLIGYVASDGGGAEVSGEVTVSVSRGALFVDDDAADDGDGLSWETAFRTIQAAVDSNENVAGTEIWVKAGTYRPAAINVAVVDLSNKPGTIVRGGFSQTLTPPGALATRPRDGEGELNEPTSLNGDFALDDPTYTENSFHILVGGSNVVVDGLTLENGYAAGTGSLAETRGAGVYLSGATNVQLIDVRVFSNQAVGDPACGGGLYVGAGCSVSIIDSRFEYNYAFGRVGAFPGFNGHDGFGGGLCADQGGDIAITNSRFYGNSAEGGRGGAGRVTVPGPLFTAGGNGGQGYGGALYLDSDSDPGSLTIIDTDFDYNHALGGPGGNGGRRFPNGSSGSDGGYGYVGFGGSLYVRNFEANISGGTYSESSAEGGDGGNGAHGGSDSGAFGNWSGGHGGNGGYGYGGVFFFSLGSDVWVEDILIDSSSAPFEPNHASGGRGGNGGNATADAISPAPTNGGSAGDGGNGVGPLLYAEDGANPAVFRLRNSFIGPENLPIGGDPGSPGSGAGGGGGGQAGSSGTGVNSWLACGTGVSSCVENTCHTYNAACYVEEGPCPLDATACHP